ncbi:MAG: hypothetical protein A2087_05875 [Spirochaetes bacterium GWD1_61_31]|nr:MAG: hypothetical protein A2Y37_03825 [Spirochaetes bacterium GWB1_60_80]OHD28773.1 MAG: hypothetical protein A2004_09240 [Spirochaetes bacterium GWC1_61_12]OHD42999.1 MAG: hypothetical protein A2087_05875 [Spirochaetes bacterium GWD1_61_31]OHD46594.1 MAG: hypothetical protein A2Y35_14815 [Spirochaetes bacterium GWE1_60_18]OHD61028.1 MAG: hypothetical protein A2Y32_05090 [Spirochaetes bacterium GWF1_60_12]HAP44775.1 1,4-dihydroxy-2-naphthoate polyprenyltransferase [Spirochaetaceae bacterium
MSLKSYLKLVEIQTKVASVIPFLAGSLYARGRFGAIDWVNAGLMLVALLAIDMATTAGNNYMDYKRAFQRHGFGYEVHNAIVRDGMSEGFVKLVLILLLAVATAFGLLLTARTDLLVLALGIGAGLVGFLYSFGPVPISRTPFGELFSGGVMGLLIPFIAVYIQAPAGSLLSWNWTAASLQLNLNWPELLYLALVDLPLFGGIANIMLANNLCDQAEDLANRRYTLPHFVGTKAGLLLFAALYAIGSLAALSLVILGVFPWWFLAFGLTIVPVAGNVRRFFAKQSKAETFALSVKNFVLQGLALCLLLLARVFIQ